MSLAYLAGDVVTIMQLALKVVLNTRKACDEYDELTQDVFAMHIALRRLKQELKTPESLLNRSGDSYKEEIEFHIRGCNKVLGVLNTILKRYIRLNEKAGSWRKLCQQIRFGNGEVGDLQDLRSKVILKTSALSLTLNLASLGSMGRIEKQINRYMREPKITIHGTAARLIANSNGEGSVLTSYADDDKSVWEEFHKDLYRDGFSSSRLKRHRALIMAYVAELVERGLFDDVHSGPPAKTRMAIDTSSHPLNMIHQAAGKKKTRIQTNDSPLPSRSRAVISVKRDKNTVIESRCTSTSTRISTQIRSRRSSQIRTQTRT